MSTQFCTPCKERKGQLVAAHRIVGSVPMCDGCFRGESSAATTVPPPQPLRSHDLQKPLVPQNKEKETVDDMTCRKCGKHHWKIKNGICKGCAEGVGGPAPTKPKRAQKSDVAGGGGIAGAIEELERQREEIGALIESLKKYQNSRQPYRN